MTDDPAPDGPETSVRRWLETAGFPLEMRTARALRQGHGLSVTSSDYYIDLVTERPREIDLVAERHVAIDTRLAVIVSAVIECKTSPDNQQWVGFQTASRLPALLAAKERPSSELGRRWLELLQVPLYERSLPAPMLFNEHPQVHGLVTTRQDKDRDTAYKAVQGAAHAAHARVAAWDRALTSQHGNRVVGFVLPVVVLSGDLFTAYLADDTDEVKVRRTERLQVVSRQPVGDRDYTVVDVVTEAALPGLVQDLALTANGFTEQGVDAARDAYSDLMGRQM